MLLSPFPMARRGDIQISAARLKARREALFLSQSELATSAKMGLSNVQRLERGSFSALMRNNVPDLAGALRMTEDEFMGKIAVENLEPPAPSPPPSPTDPKSTREIDIEALKLMEVALKMKHPRAAMVRALDLLDTGQRRIAARPHRRKNQEE